MEKCNFGYFVYPKLALATLAEMGERTRTEKLLALSKLASDHLPIAGLAAAGLP